MASNGPFQGFPAENVPRWVVLCGVRPRPTSAGDIGGHGRCERTYDGPTGEAVTPPLTGVRLGRTPNPAT
jgi:hypothetical protein